VARVSGNDDTDARRDAGDSPAERVGLTMRPWSGLEPRRRQRWGVATLAVVASVLGCVRHQRTADLQPGAGCEVTPPADAFPMAPERIPLLAGVFRLTLVSTSGPTRWWGVSYLKLRPADSAEVAQSKTRRLGYFRRVNLHLIGRQRWPRDSVAHAGPAEMDGGTLYLGCRDCFDASPDFLTATAVAASGFWGTWHNYQTGIGVLVDKHGHRLPDPAGHFCAVRIDSSAARLGLRIGGEPVPSFDTVLVAPFSMDSSVVRFLKSAEGMPQPRRLIIRDAVRWQAFWDTATVHGAVGPPTPPPVDFSREMLIVASNGSRSSSDQVRIAGVEVTGDSLLVHVYSRVNAVPMCSWVGGPTPAPMAIVRVARDARRVAFAEEWIDEKCSMPP
jgi:hypothetical protein